MFRQRFLAKSGKLLFLHSSAANFPSGIFRNLQKNNPETLRKRVIWRTFRLTEFYALIVGFHFCAFYYGDARFLMILLPFWPLFGGAPASRTEDKPSQPAPPSRRSILSPWTGAPRPPTPIYGGSLATVELTGDCPKGPTGVL